MQAIISGGGAQAVEVYAQDSAGRPVKPSAATARIVDLTVSEDGDDADRIVLATSAATVDTVSTTTTAYAGRQADDARKVPLTSVASISVGRMYLLSYAGASESVLVDRIDGSSVFGREKLRGEYSSGATFVGLRVSASFPSAWANDATQLDRDPPPLFGVDWTFTGVTGPLVVRTLASIERRGTLLRATVQDLFDADPQLASSVHNRSKLESHLRQADREITAMLMHRGTRPADTDEGLTAALAVQWLAVELAYGVLEAHETRREWAGEKARYWAKMLLSGHKRPDAAETSRAEDKARTTRRGLPVSSIRGTA